MSLNQFPPPATGATGAAGGDLTGMYPNPTIGTAKVTYAKIQDISAASRLLGRGSASGSGPTEEIQIGTNLTMTGTTISATGPAGSSAFGLVQMIRQANYSM